MENSATPVRDALAKHRAGYHRWRLTKDKIAKHLIAVGGISVIVFILLIFFYLAYVVIPLFAKPEANRVAQYPSPGGCAATAMVALEEQAEIGTRYCSDGQVVFFRTDNGAAIKTANPTPTPASSFALADPAGSRIAWGLTDGRVVIASVSYAVTFPNNQRTIEATLTYPFGDKPLAVDSQPLVKLALRDNEQEATVVAYTQDRRLVVTHLEKKQSFLDDEATIEQKTFDIPPVAHAVDFLLLDKNQSHLFAIASSGEMSHFDVSHKDHVRLIELINVSRATSTSITAVRFLAGDLSLLVGDSAGTTSQWTLVRQEDNVARLTKIRSFSANKGSVTAVAPEHARKGFAAVDQKGNLALYHSTAERTLLVTSVSQQAIDQVAIAPRANAILLEDVAGNMQFWRIKNEHPEVSWSALWGKVWYENYSGPEYLWQSSAANEDFEPKFSLIPVTFGTIKAAFYAMLLAVPMSLMAALYTAQFMAPRMRTWVKPSIEVMEALPTVILGFLAGLWLAPFVERNMPGIFTLLIAMPIMMLLAAYAWSRAPRWFRHRVPDGWEAALLLPVVCFVIWVSIAISPTVEALFFGGDMRKWLTNDMGVAFDQRNAVVVGLAMGFAVIPTIYSIAEDAVFAVPRHLINGSLALGATAWQTMIRVVLLTASPGIFSAIMIGVGRAVGETMIVLMATGNTAVMNFSAFLGLRTLSANIAVELPESALNSTHFRVLFLAGLVLFLFTFAVNTVAEIVRQRLRRKYSSL